VIKRFALLAALAAMLAGCSAGTVDRRAGGPGVAKRVVSLMPSLTADLCRLGAGKALVGVSEYSPTATCAARAPIVGNFASVDAERIVGLHPDVVVGIPSQQRMTQTLRSAGIATVFFNDDSFADIFTDITGLGRLTGHTAQARALVARLQARTAALRATERFKRRPRVFVALGTGPIWTVGPQSYLSQIIDLAGGRNAVGRLPAAYAEYSAEALLAAQPDAIVTDRFTHLSTVLDREPWRSLRAVREHHVYVAPDEFERPGPAYNEGLHWLIERLRPLAT
jgi:iron complex transport system substrate-binding protein